MSEKGTEQGSPQRKQKAREKGDVVRSRELLSAVALLCGVGAVGAGARSFVQGWGGVFRESMRSSLDEPGAHAVAVMLTPALVPVAFVLAASFAGALAVGVAQGGGVSLHGNALQLKFERLNPVSNLGHMVSLRSLTRVVKSLVPAAVMVGFGWTALKTALIPLPVLSLVRLPTAFGVAYGLSVDAAWVMLAWSGLDYCVEWMAWNKRMKMTKQEMRDEVKEAMGNPQVKGKIRQLQQARRRHKVKADMSRASVVVTNPTHYAVALEFSFETMGAPTVLAKGRDLHAAEIREEARWAGIPLIENPPLARSLYRMVEPGQSIPFELYAAVASILAYLYREKMEERMRRERARAEREAQRVQEHKMTTAIGMMGARGGM